MAASWPGVVLEWDASEQCDHVLGIEIENATYAEGRRGGLVSWRSPFDAPRRQFDLANTTPAPQPVAADAIVTVIPPKRPDMDKPERAIKPATPRQKPSRPLDIMPKLSSAPSLTASKVNLLKQATGATAAAKKD